MAAGWVAEQLGVDVEQVNHVISGFLTGFLDPGETQPGHALHTERFKVVFEGVTEDGENSVRSRELETLYDWTAVMKTVLGACGLCSCLEDIEAKCEEEVANWLYTYEGCGLLLDFIESADSYLLTLIRTYLNWDEATGGPRTRQKVFKDAKTAFELIQGESLDCMVRVWFEEDEELEERSKRCVMEFQGPYNMVATFVVEKKRLVNGNLLELASEAVARCLRDEEELLELEVPVILRSVVRDKYRDVEWVRGHWAEDAEDETVDEREEEEEGQDVFDETEDNGEEEEEVSDDGQH